MNALTKHDATKATKAQRALAPVIEALKTITPETAGFEQCRQTITELEKHIVQANAVFAEIEKHFEEIGGAAFVDKASNRFYRLTRDITGQAGNLRHLIAGHEHKVNALKADGFTGKQIEQISPYPQTQIDEYNAEIARMTAEKDAIAAFIASAPAYETRLLAGTVFDTRSIEAEVAA